MTSIETRPWAQRLEDDNIIQHSKAAAHWTSCAVGEQLGLSADDDESDVFRFLENTYPRLYTLGVAFSFATHGGDNNEAKEIHDKIKDIVTECKVSRDDFLRYIRDTFVDKK